MITPEDIKGDSESAEQKRLFAWASLNRPTYPQLKWLHAIPNANSHRQVAEGVRGGVADICLPWPKQAKDYQGFNEPFRCGYHGLYIELKTKKRRKEKNGGCSDEQIEFGLYCGASGYMWYCCYGWIEARDKILEYLK